MKISKNKKFIALLGLALLLLCGMIGVALAANVSTGNGDWVTGQLSYSFVSVSDGTTGNGAKGTVSASGSTLTVTATSSKYVKDNCNGNTDPYPTTTNVTVTNISGFPLRVDSLSVPSGTATIAGVGAGDTIGVGGSFTITVTSTPSSTTAGSETATAKITISVTEMKSVNITAAASPYVDYTLNGKTVSKGGSDVTFETDAGTTISLPAITAPDGYEFIGWRIGSKALTKASSFTADSSYTVYPVIVTEGTTDRTYFKVGNTQYTFWEDAVNAAMTGSNKQIILAADCTLPDTVLDNAVLPSGGTYVQNDGSGHPVYLIPSGVTFIVPHAESYTYKTTGDHPYACETQGTSISGTATAVGTSVFRELTVPSGASVSVSGVMAVGGTTNGVDQISGDHANVHLEAGAAIHVKSGGRLSSCGYIYGDGTVTAESGGYVYMPFSILDFRGGGYTVGVAGKLASKYGIDFPFPSGENGISPFTRYHMGAIQTRLVIEYGATLIGYVDLYAEGGHNNANAHIIGSSDGLIILKSGTAEITYDANTYIQVATNFALGKTKIKVDGDAEFGHLMLTVTVDAVITKITATIDTAKINFPIPYNFDIEIVSGTFDVPNSVMLLPGASVIVDEGATLNVNSNLTVYDGLHDFTAGPASETNAALKGYEKGSGAEKESSYTTTVTSGSNYPTTATLQGVTFGGSGSADLIVNGTMNLNSGSSFGGVVQTSSSGAARIFVASSKVGTSTKTQIGAVGSWNFSSKTYGFAGATVRELQGQIIDTGTGKRTNIVAGQTYKPAAGTDSISSYTYTLYYDSAKNNIELTDAVACILQGSWYNYEVDVYMVLDGQKSGPVKMYFAYGAALPDGYYYNENKTNPATSVTGNQPLYFIGEAEAEIIRADNKETTKYPSVRNAVRDVNVGDTIVLLKDLTDFSSIIGPEAGQEFTFDMNGHNINYRSTPFASLGGIMTVNMSGGKITNVVGEKHYNSPVVLMNHSQGSITLNLNGGEISVTGTASAPLTNGGVENGGNLTIDLGGGKWNYLTGLAVPTASNEDGTQHHDLTVMAVYQNKAMFNNAGTLTIKDTVGGGSVTTDLISNGTTWTPATPTTNYVSVIRNNAGATLVLDGGTFILDPSGDINGDAVLSTAATPMPMALYSAVVLNFGDIKSSGEGSAVSLKGMGGYALYNFKGGTVDLDLKGGTIELAEYKKGTAKNPAMYKDKVAVGNDGKMTLKSSAGKGNILMNVPTSSGSLYGILNSSNAAIFSTLTLNGVNIQLLNAPTNSSYGVYNRAGSKITEITNTSVEVGLGNALYSIGSLTTITTIGDITGSSFKSGITDEETGTVSGAAAFTATATDIGNIKDSTFTAEATIALNIASTAASATAEAYAPTVGNITGSRFTAKTSGITIAGAAANANGPAKGPKVGNIEGNTFETGTYAIGITGGAVHATGGASAAPTVGNISGNTITAGSYGISVAGAVGNTAFPNATATVGDLKGNIIHSGTSYCISLSYANAGAIEDCQLTASKLGNNSGALHVINYSSVDCVKNTDIVSEDTATTTNNTAYGIYTTNSKFGDLTGVHITVAKGGGIYAAGTAENINTPVDRVLATFGDITGTVITTQTTVGVNISHTQIGNLDHVTITTVSGNGITATNGCVIGDITDSTITSGSAIGLSTASFAATATAPTSIAPKVGNITGTTINAKTGGIYLNGQAANAYSTIPVAPTIGDIKNTTINAGTYCFSSNGALGNASNNYGDGALATVGVIEDCKFYSVAPAKDTGVIVNANSSIVHILRTELVMTAPTANTSYGIYNNGGTIDYIKDCKIDANAGIYNRNTVSAAYNLAGGSGAVICFYGHIGAIKDTDITVGQYAINNGGVIDEISGQCTFIAAPASAQVPRTSGTAALNGNVQCYTVYNTNTWWGTATAWWQYDVTSESGALTRTIEYKWEDEYRPTIGKITDEVQIIALNTSTAAGNGYALYNAGVINEISGNVVIDTHVHPDTTATITYSNYAIQNTAGGRIDAIKGNVKITAGAYAIANSLGTVYKKNVTTYTATTVNDNQATDWTREFYYDYTGIGEITGDGDKGIVIEATTNNYAIQNTARMGDITGKVTITADNGTWAIQNSTGTAANIISTVKTTPGEKKEIYEEFMIASIGTIGGGDSEILIRSAGNTNNSWTLQNNGTIKAILEGVTVETTVGYTGMGAIANGTGAIPATKKQTVRVLGTSASGDSDFVVERNYSYHRSSIGEIRGVTVSTAMNYALRNYGYIGSIADSSFTAATGYGIVNWVSNQYYYASDTESGITRHTVNYLHSATPIATSTTISGTAYVGETNISYINEPAVIGSMDGVTIKVTNGSYGLHNLGTIGPITNTSITVSGSNAIHNVTRPYASSYKVTMDGYITKGDSGAYVANAITDSTTEYPVPTIESIGVGVKLQAAYKTLENGGQIGSVVGGETEDTRVSIIATSGTGSNQHAIFNYGGVISYVERNGAATDISTYTSAKIGVIKNASIENVITPAIQNGNNTANYIPVIGEIGEGTEVYSAGGHAVYNYVANANNHAQIKKITGGIFTTGASGNFYALYNASPYNATAQSYPIEISGGDFKSGSNDRAHAIYDADNTNRYTYPDGMFLSQGTRDVTFADGEPGTKYYFITVNGFYLIFEGNGATEGEMEKQMVSLADLNAEVTLTKNGFTFTLDGVDLDFLGWATVKEASEKKLDDVWTGKVQTLKNLLEAALGTEIQAGTEVKLYAVWNTEDASTYTITWGDLDFTYTRPTYRWDAENMQYVLETAGSWRATGEKEPIITVEVAGDAGYEVRLAYLSENGFGFGLTFSMDGVEVADNTFTIPGNGKAVVEAMLTGEPGDGSADKIKVGTVTIELTKQESQQTP